MVLRKATRSEVPVIWEILQQAIAQRKRDGSTQWQNGYPNEQSILNDLDLGQAYVFTENGLIIAYAAVIFGVEPAYNDIVGNWISNGDYVVVHRVATSDSVKGRRMATELFRAIEKLALEKGVFSIKVDTNFDNVPMLKLLDKLNYIYCGEVQFSGSPRRAYEKVLTTLR